MQQFFTQQSCICSLALETKAPLIAPNSAGSHPVIRHIPQNVHAIRNTAAMLCFPSVILRHACDPRPFFCSSRLLSLEDHDFVFHSRAFRICRSVVFGVRGDVLNTHECNLHLTHRLLAGCIGISSMQPGTQGGVGHGLAARLLPNRPKDEIAADPSAGERATSTDAPLPPGHGQS
jgi:hypothetical protein